MASSIARSAAAVSMKPVLLTNRNGATSRFNECPITGHKNSIEEEAKRKTNFMSIEEATNFTNTPSELSCTLLFHVQPKARHQS